MKWIDPLNLIKLEKTPFLENNISKIILFISKIKKNIIKEFEKSIIEKYKLIKKNERVYYTKNELSLIKFHQVKMLMELAKIHSLPLIRICLHNNDRDNIHEMIMVHTRPHFVGPLKQNRNESLSYHAIDGFGEIILYSKNGEIEKKVEIDSSNKRGFRFCRLRANQIRSIESKSDYFIFLEVCSGSFKDSDTIWITK